jgi:transposase
MTSEEWTDEHWERARHFWQLLDTTGLSRTVGRPLAHFFVSVEPTWGRQSALSMYRWLNTRTDREILAIPGIGPKSMKPIRAAVRVMRTDPWWEHARAMCGMTGG